MLYMKGRVTRQAHVDIPKGTIEEEVGRKGFFGRYAHLYRTRPMVEWTSIEGDLRPIALHTERLGDLSRDYVASRIPFLRNSDVILYMAQVNEAMPFFFRNADGDEVLFVHAGEGRIETDFGPLEYEKGDYLVIPRCTTYRLHPSKPTRLLIVESVGEIRLPDKGPLGQHALFDPAVINVPEPVEPPEEEEGTLWQVKIQRMGRITTFSYPFYPMNVVGWKGDLTVWQLNIRDIRPVLSDRYHLPPTAHITFLSTNFVICTFLPRPLETGDPGALKVPFYHSNVDYDEVLFYHEGEFFSRDGIEPGMVTFHPQGIPHGPQKRAIEASVDKTHTNEKAVMVDTRYPLELTEEARSVEWEDYWKSWQTPEMKE